MHSRFPSASSFASQFFIFSSGFFSFQLSSPSCLLTSLVLGIDLIAHIYIAVKQSRIALTSTWICFKCIFHPPFLFFLRFLHNLSLLPLTLKLKVALVHHGLINKCSLTTASITVLQFYLCVRALFDSVYLLLCVLDKYE